MDPNNNSSNIVYTKDQLLEIRAALISGGGLDLYPVANFVISRDPEKRSYFRKPKPITDGASAPSRPPKKFEHCGGSLDLDGGGDASQPNSASWRRTLRSTGSVPHSPLDAPTSKRHDSGSSNGDDSGSGIAPEGSQVRREFDWTLGCGKWRHRSTSGSERGVHKGSFFVNAGRGRSRGGGNGVVGTEGNGGIFTGSRGRSFMRRPFQHGGAGPSRGIGRGGFKSSALFSNLACRKLFIMPLDDNIPSTTPFVAGPDHGPMEEDFEPHDEQHQQHHQRYPPHQHHHQHQQTYMPHKFHKDAGSEEEQEASSQQRDDHPQPSTTTLKATEQPIQECDSQSVSLPSHHESDISTTANPTIEMLSQPPKDGFPFMSNLPPHQPLPPPPMLLPQSVSSVQPEATSTMWYYRDPFGNVQGPYDDATMATWFSAGYFTVSIEVRRECDKVFSPITDYIARLGRFPFVNSRDLSPIESSLVKPVVTSTVPPAGPPPPPPAQSQSVVPSFGSVGSMLSASTPMQSGAVPTPDLVPQQQMHMPILTSAHQQQQNPSAPASEMVGGQALMNSPTSTSKTFFDLANMSALTLMDMLRLRRVAQMATDSTSAVSRNGIIEALAGLNIASPGISTSTFDSRPQNLPPSPPNIIDLQQLEAAIHRRQREEQAAQGLMRQQELQQKQPLQEVVTPPAQVDNQEAPIEIPVKEVAAQPQKKRKEKATAKEATVQDQPPVELAPVRKEQESITATTGATNVAKKKKRKSKNGTAAAEIKSEKQGVQIAVVNEASLEPEDDWVAVPPSGATFHAQPIPSNATLWHEEGDKGQTTKKSKRKKRGKLSAAELQQQAWEQEEERRRRANAERIARAEAEKAAMAAAMAEEEAIAAPSSASATKISAVARRQLEEAQRARQQQLAREAARREAEANLVNFKLPPTVRWGGANKNVAAGSSATVDTTAPASMVDIFAAQMQEEEFARLKPNAGRATFASKVASGSHTQQPLVNNNSVGKAKALIVSEAQPATQQQQPTKVPANPKQPSAHPMPKTPTASKTTPAVAPPALNVPSIWNMAVDSNPTKPTNSKKDRKKKKSNLLTGSIISLTPKAKEELMHWCERQLSTFSSGNVDIPTLISLLCDIEEDQEILECVESSFGKSQRVSKFSKAFVEKRANLMGAKA
ncbi:hypothetical protein Aperf_G00000024731 [Anoplocephala perfoliata]